MSDQAWVPSLGEGDDLDWHLVQKWMVSGRDGSIPRRYETAVDVNTGEILWRQNRRRSH